MDLQKYKQIDDSLFEQLGLKRMSDEEVELKLAIHAWVYEKNYDLIDEYWRKYKYVSPVKAPVRNQEIPDVDVPPGVRSIYELTLTMPVDDPHFLKQKLEVICKSNMFEVVKYLGAFELTQAGLPHIHAILYSKRKFLDASKMKKIFPHRFELKKVRDHHAYLNYIFKEKDNNVIIQYCQEKGITQIFENA